MIMDSTNCNSVLKTTQEYRYYKLFYRKKWPLYHVSCKTRREFLQSFSTPFAIAL